MQRLEAQGPGRIQQILKIMGDGGPGLLGDLVFGGQVKVVGPVAQTQQGLGVAGEDAGADMNDIVEVDPADRQPAQVLGGADLGATQIRVVGLVGPTQKAAETAAHRILEGAQAVQVAQALVQRLVKTDDHGGGAAHARVQDGLLGGVIVFGLVFGRTVSHAEAVIEDLGPATGDPAGARGGEFGRHIGVVALGALGDEHEFGHRHLVEGEIGEALAHKGEEPGVVLHPQVGVKAPVEAHHAATKGAQGLDLGGHLLLAEQVGVRRPGEAVEGAIVAAGHTHIGVVDDGHLQEAGLARRVEASPTDRGQLLQQGVVGLLPERRGVGAIDALAGADLCGEGSEHGAPMGRRGPTGQS